MKAKGAVRGARAAAEQGEAAKTAANRCSTPCPKRHSAHSWRFGSTGNSLF